MSYNPKYNAPHKVHYIDGCHPSRIKGPRLTADDWAQVTCGQCLRIAGGEYFRTIGRRKSAKANTARSALADRLILEQEALEVAAASASAWEEHISRCLEHGFDGLARQARRRMRGDMVLTVPRLGVWP